MGQDESDDVIVAPAAGEVAAFASDLPEHLGFLSRHPHLTQVRHVGNAEVMDEARVQLCGTFAVELRGRRIDNLLTGRQGRLLFAYLVVSRLLPVSRNSLIDALWSDAPTADASGALNALISKTRAVVGGDVLWGRTELILTLPEPAQVDVEVALAKLQGIGGSELPGAERAARELVEVAPFRESGHLLLMRALAATGNVAEALAAYERLRVSLRDELGVAPSEAVQEAYLGLLGQLATRFRQGRNNHAGGC
jgi:DNA-binding SARP family transcriptional activator